MTETRHAGHYVREARIRVFGEHSQERAAKAAGVSQPYLSQIERGERPLTGNTAIKLEQGWELDAYALVRWSKAMASVTHSREEVVSLLARCAAVTHRRSSVCAPIAAVA